MNKWNIDWGAVSECNMKCQFCYSQKVRKDSSDFRQNDWISFIDNNYEYVNTINYGTGENTIFNEWYTLVDHIGKNYGIPQSLTSNGYFDK